MAQSERDARGVRQAHRFRLQAKESSPTRSSATRRRCSIADIPTYPWIVRHFNFGVELADWSTMLKLYAQYRSRALRVAWLCRDGARIHAAKPQ